LARIDSIRTLVCDFRGVDRARLQQEYVLKCRKRGVGKRFTIRGNGGGRRGE
jgi:hypothetical protein